MSSAVQPLCAFPTCRSYLSIPQRNPILKGLSISSLGVYASVCKYFVVIAPKVLHISTKSECNSDTYQRRGWVAHLTAQTQLALCL